MSNILVAVDEQNLQIIEAPKIAAQGVKEDYIIFSFDSSWSGFGKVAFFYRAEDEGKTDKIYRSAIDADGYALVPHEVTDREGKICFCVAGTKGDVVYTTEILKYRIVKGLYVDGQETEPPTPGIYEQILTLLGVLQTGLNQEASIRADADSALNSRVDEIVERETTGATQGSRIVEYLSASIAITSTGDDQSIVLTSETTEFADMQDLTDPVLLNVGFYVLDTSDQSIERVRFWADDNLNSASFFDGGYYGVTAKQAIRAIVLDIPTTVGGYSITGKYVRIKATFTASAPLDLTELTDIRVGVDGTVYPSAGTAVRTQINNISTELSSYKDYNLLLSPLNQVTWAPGIISSMGLPAVSTTRLVSNYINVGAGTEISVLDSQYDIYIGRYNPLTNGFEGSTGWVKRYIVMEDCAIKILIRKGNTPVTELPDPATMISIILKRAVSDPDLNSISYIDDPTAPETVPTPRFTDNFIDYSDPALWRQGSTTSFSSQLVSMTEIPTPAAWIGKTLYLGAIDSELDDILNIYVNFFKEDKITKVLTDADTLHIGSITSESFKYASMIIPNETAYIVVRVSTSSSISPKIICERKPRIYLGFRPITTAAEYEPRRLYYSQEELEDRLFNVANISDLLEVTSHYVALTGNTIYSAVHNCSNFIAVKSGDIINYNLIGTNANVVLLGFYAERDESTLLNTVCGINLNVPAIGAFVCPSDGYIRITNRINYPNGYCFRAQRLPDSVRYELNLLNSDYPNYWDNEVKRCIDAARDIQLNGPTDLIEFFHITDIHWKVNAKQSPRLINHIAKELGIDIVLANGDYIGSHDTTKIEAVNELNDFIKSFNSDLKLLPNSGNHDFNNVANTDHPEAYLSTEDGYKFVEKRASGYAQTYDSAEYLYYDDQVRKVRYILFRYYFVSNYISDEVMSFIEDKVNELTSDWSVVLACHGYLLNAINPETDEYEWQDEQEYAGASDLKTKLLALKANASADIIALIIGHAHRDNSKVLTDGSTNLLVVCTSTDCYPQSEVFNSWLMTLGTDTEQCFEIVQIDRTARKIYMTRVGAGVDREFSY